MSTHVTGDLSVFTVGGGTLLATLANASAEFTEKQQDGSAIVRLGKSNQGTKLSGTINASLYSTVSTPDRVSHLDLSAIALGAKSYLGDVSSLTFKGSMENKPAAGVGAWWERPIVMKRDFMATIDLDATQNTVAALAVAMLSTNYSARDTVLGLTLNGVPISLAMRMAKMSHKFDKDDLQRISIELAGKDPGAGNQVTSPVGTSSLLEKALNAPTTPLAFTLTSRATEGVTYAGNIIFTDFSFAIKDGELVATDYTWITTGTATATAVA